MSGFNLGPPAAGTGFGFGANTTAPAATTGFGFGATTTPGAPGAPAATTGFGFGATTTATAPATTTGFGFGATTTAATTTTAPAATTGFGFGATTTTPAATTGFGFGTAAPPSGTTGGFGFGTTTTFGLTQPNAANAATLANAAAATAPQHQPLPSGAILPLGGYVRDLQDPVVKRINDISDSINPSSPNCLFQYVLYNLLPPNSPFRGKLTKPPHANEEVWRKGLAENPDQDKFVPCLVVGWPDLLIRLQEQQKALNTHITTMQYLSNDATSSLINAQHSLHRQLEDTQQKQALLNSRILNLVSRIQAIKCGNMPLTESELEYKRRLDELMVHLTTPGENLDKVQSLGELVTIQANLRDRERAQKMKQAPKKSGSDGGDGRRRVSNSNSPRSFDSLGAIDEDIAGSDGDLNGDNVDYSDDSEEDEGGYYYTNANGAEDKKRKNRRGAGDNSQSLKNSMAHLLSVVNDQSMMIKELVDEVSLCVTDLQVCDEVLQQRF